MRHAENQLLLLLVEFLSFNSHNKVKLLEDQSVEDISVVCSVKKFNIKYIVICFCNINTDTNLAEHCAKWIK